jgi:hypothetical protein
MRRFEPMIVSGRKRHTIRKHRPDIQPGKRLDLYVDPRQHTMRLIFRTPCIRKEEILIDRFGLKRGFGRVIIKVSDVELSDSEMNRLAWHDGFEHIEDFMLFWRDDYPFDGEIIHWDYEKRREQKAPV